jgi:hypothetical protein
VNADWHRAHVLPRRASEDERIAWHLAHAATCGCRAVPAKLAVRMLARGIAVPAQAVMPQGVPSHRPSDREGR